MRARYYNSEIRRFINQDIVTGSIENSQSLNRYAYCQGNPVNYLDPFGLSPQSFGSWAGHTILNLLSFVPVFGNAADAFNAVWYLYEGNYAEAIACAVGAIPFIGNIATGFNIGSKVVKGCNIAANGGKAAIGFYNGVQNVMNIDHMIRTGTGRWYDYLGQGVQFGLNMFVSAMGVNGAWNGISNLVGELNYKKMQKLAEDVSWKDIDGGAELTELLENINSDGNDINWEAHNVVNYAKYKEVLRTAESANPLVESLRTTGELPSNYITKKEAIQAGWKKGKALGHYVEGGQIGGDIFLNENEIVPNAFGREWYEADVGLFNTVSRAKQAGTRLLYSNDGLLYITYDHYKTAYSIGTWK